jgi:hypothetical protein
MLWTRVGDEDNDDPHRILMPVQVYSDRWSGDPDTVDLRKECSCGGSPPTC